jgi:hypothetical protein
LIILYILIPIFIISKFSYFVIENRKKTQIIKDKKNLKLKTKKNKIDLKNEIDKMLSLQLCSQKTSQLIYNIANNYFVFQKSNDESIKKYNSLIIELKNSISGCIATSEGLRGRKYIQDKLLDFSEKLPSSNTSYNKHFYEKVLPYIIKEIQ